MSDPRVVYVALIGFGSANRALAKLLLDSQSYVLQRQNLAIRCSGIFTRHGAVWDMHAGSIDLAQALAAAESGANLATTNTDGRAQRFVGGDSGIFGTEQTVETLRGLREAGKCDAVLEAIVANYEDAEPAASFARFTLNAGIHYITANKSPVALCYSELTKLAEQNGCKFRFESACGDGVPIFNLARHCLPACKVLKFEAILNTTTNVILQEMEVNDVTMEEGLKRAQEMGIAEADPSGDIDGYDAAVKCICLARVLMGANRPESIEGVHRDSLRVVSLAEVRSTLPNRIKFVCTGQINEATSTVELAVRKTVVSPQDFMLYNVCGADNVWRFEFDNLCPITLVQHNGTTRDTGYGLLADLLDVLGYCERP